MSAMFDASGSLIIPVAYVAIAYAAANFVSTFLGYLKPVLEQIPRLGKEDPAHDAVVRLVSLLLNLAAAVGLGFAFGVFSGPSLGLNIVLMAVQVVMQAGTSEFAYRGIGSSAGSTATRAPGPATPPPASAPAAPAPSLAALAAPAAVNVASALNAAIVQAAAQQASQP